MSKKYIAEFFGTLVLTFAVLAGIAFTGNLPLSVPVIAGLVLGLFVYTIGPVSGTHINPAVTCGLYYVKKISRREALAYGVAQFAGALGALLFANLFDIASPMSGEAFSLSVFVAEVLGMTIFTFGIASVVYGKVHESMSGIVIGGSLTLGVIVASLAGAGGILNPAVALGLGAFTFVYVFAPFVGAIIGFSLYRHLVR